MSQDLSETWSPGIEYILEEIRLNAMTISEYHKEKYYYTKGYLKYFRIPTIVFSAMNSVFSVGLQPYCPQPIISLICCLISLICGVISSVELFLSIQSTMENELISSKDFYLLSVDIFKILSLERNTRMVNGKVYLDETYQTYCKLIENSNIVSKEMKNMIKPSNFTPMLSDTKKEVENELVVMKRSLIKDEPDEEDMEEKEREEEEYHHASSLLEKENIMISELEENNNEEEQEEKDREKIETIEEEKTTIQNPPKIEDKVKRKYTKKKVPDV